MINYNELSQQLRNDKIGITAAELHGFLSGLLAGGNLDDSWQTLTSEMLNNGEQVKEPLKTQIKQLYEQTKQQLLDNNFEFQLILNEQDLFTKIDGLIDWVNHFLLGIGLMQPHLTKLKGDVGEAIYDLRQIALLSYNPSDDPEELGFAFEEILEYVRICAILCYEKFNEDNVTTTIH